MFIDLSCPTAVDGLTLTLKNLLNRVVFLSRVNDHRTWCNSIWLLCSRRPQLTLSLSSMSDRLCHGIHEKSIEFCVATSCDGGAPSTTLLGGVGGTFTSLSKQLSFRNCCAPFFSYNAHLLNSGCRGHYLPFVQLVQDFVNRKKSPTLRLAQIQRAL